MIPINEREEIVITSKEIKRSANAGPLINRYSVIRIGRHN
jgi:hypothetical protein